MADLRKLREITKELERQKVVMDSHNETAKSYQQAQVKIKSLSADIVNIEREIAKTYPDAEYMDTWVWFQSGINTDGAHNPKTSRKLVSGDIISLNTFPMISGYYTALERTLFLDNIDDDSLKRAVGQLESDLDPLPDLYASSALKMHYAKELMKRNLGSWVS